MGDPPVYPGEYSPAECPMWEWTGAYLEHQRGPAPPAGAPPACAGHTRPNNPGPGTLAGLAFPALSPHPRANALLSLSLFVLHAAALPSSIPSIPCCACPAFPASSIALLFYRRLLWPEGCACGMCVCIQVGSHTFWGAARRCRLRWRGLLPVAVPGDPCR